MSKPKAYKDLTQAEKDRTEDDLRLYEDIETLENTTAEQIESDDKPDVSFPASTMDGMSETDRAYFKSKRVKPLTEEEFFRIPKPADKWIVKHIIPSNSFCLIHGKPQSKKTFIALSIMKSVACGLPSWLGYKIPRARKVFYIMAEGLSDLEERLKALNIQHITGDTNEAKAHQNNNRENFFLWNFQELKPKIYADNTIGRDIFAEQCKQIFELDSAPLICVDTIRTTFDGSENDSQEVASFIEQLRDIAKPYNASVIAIGHNRKGEDVTEAFRGSGAWEGDSDCVISFEDKGENEDGTICYSELRIEKQKIGRKEPAFSIELHEQNLGEDEDEEPITSLFVYGKCDKADYDKRKDRENKGYSEFKMLLYVYQTARPKDKVRPTINDLKTWIESHIGCKYRISDKDGIMHEFEVRLPEIKNPSDALASDDSISKRKIGRKYVYFVKPEAFQKHRVELVGNWTSS